MSGALFLGNSHVAAFKLAHNAIDPLNTLKCSFACARGADLAFTKVELGMLKAGTDVELDAESISYSFPGWMEAQYLAKRRPTEDVGMQFQKTYGDKEVDVSACSSIYYVVNVSPYDFARLGEGATPVSSFLRQKLLQRMLLQKNILRSQIQEIRKCNPSCAHYLIGMPLKAIPRADPSDVDLQIISTNRNIVSNFARSYLFDDIFMPDVSLLDSSLLSACSSFTPGGCAASELFQQDPAPIITDRQHMNQSYGEAVFESFVRPRLKT